MSYSCPLCGRLRLFALFGVGSCSGLLVLLMAERFQLGVLIEPYTPTVTSQGHTIYLWIFEQQSSSAA